MPDFNVDDEVQLAPNWWKVVGGLPAGRDLNDKATVKKVRTQQGSRGGREQVVDIQWDGERVTNPYNPDALRLVHRPAGTPGGGKRKKHKKRKKISKKRSSRKRTSRKSRRRRRR